MANIVLEKVAAAMVYAKNTQSQDIAAKKDELVDDASVWKSSEDAALVASNLALLNKKNDRAADDAKNIQEAKEAAAKARKMERLRQQELMDNIKVGVGVFVLMAIVIGLFVFLMFSVAMAMVMFDAKEITKTI